MNEEEHIQYETYLKERSFLSHATLETRRGLDRSLLTLSSGAIALSLVFVDRIRPNPPTEGWLLIASWLSFTACIVVVLWSHWTSIRSFQSALEIYEESLRAGKPSDQVSSFAKATTVLNSTSMLLFVFAVVMFLVFAVVNGGTINGN